MKSSRASVYFARLWFRFGLPVKMTLGFLAIVAICGALYAAGLKTDRKTYGRGPGWECIRDDARTSDPLCFKTSPTTKKKAD